jgi:hypothetical protein
MMTVAQIDRMLAYTRDEYVNRVVSALLDALRYMYESRLASRTRRASLIRASERVLDNALAAEMLHEIRFKGRRGAFAQAVSEARRSEARLKHIVEAAAHRPGALVDVHATAFWRSVDAASKRTWGRGSRRSRRAA